MKYTRVFVPWIERIFATVVVVSAVALLTWAVAGWVVGP